MKKKEVQNASPFLYIAAIESLKIKALENHCRRV